jgi:hypothetical protein
MSGECKICGDKHPDNDCPNRVQQLRQWARSMRGEVAAPTGDLASVLAAAADRIEALEAEIAERCEDVMDAGAASGGWVDTMALSHIRNAGERLVELGLWERRPGGFGRRQFYRPIPDAARAAEKGEA